MVRKLLSLKNLVFLIYFSVFLYIIKYFDLELFVQEQNNHLDTAGKEQQLVYDIKNFPTLTCWQLIGVLHYLKKCFLLVYRKNLKTARKIWKLFLILAKKVQNIVIYDLLNHTT